MYVTLGKYSSFEDTSAIIDPGRILLGDGDSRGEHIREEFSKIPPFIFPFRTLLDEVINSVLLRYADRKLIEFIWNSKIVDPEELLNVMIWLEKDYGKTFGKPTLNAFFDPEEGFMFLEIVFPHGDWNSWKNLARNVKEKMRNKGLETLASKVAIVCLEATREQLL